jgi:acyl-coenzyme A thioesterase PaaI-like protein
MSRPEPVTQVKRRRDLALSVIVNQVPYLEFLGVHFDRHGDELTATMGFHEDLIGNPILPALHGGATAAFLEITAAWLGARFGMISKRRDWMLRRYKTAP